MTQHAATRHRTLRFEGGASHITILDAIDDHPDVRADFGADEPGVSHRDDVVIVHESGFADRLLRPPPHHHIWLPIGGRWAVEVNGPAAELYIHLDGSTLQGLSIRSSASQLALRLTAPPERVPIDVAGSVSALTLDRPASAPVTVAVRGGVRDLQVDHHAIRAAAGPVVLGEPPDSPATGYHLHIAGSVAGLRAGTGPR